MQIVREKSLIPLTLFLCNFLLISCSEIQLLWRQEVKVNSSATNVDIKDVIEKRDDSIPEVKYASMDDLPVLPQTPAIDQYCQKMQKKFDGYNWGNAFCHNISWNHVRNSVKGTPLIWTTFGREELTKNLETEVTLVMCGVHGDEITPMKFCFDIIHHLKLQPESLFRNRVAIIAPLVNPDSFFIQKPTRTNANGVDLNRNFPTADWNSRAIKLWKNWYKSDKRRNPGMKALSEPEVLFQINLIKRYNPDKIISVHAPLTILDYDGPQVEDKNLGNRAVGKMANELLVQMSQKAKGYQVKNYPFFPGSLGNWAGNERNIPTYTLELPTSDPSKNSEYWTLFKEAILMALTSPLRFNSRPVDGVEKSSNNSLKGDVKAKNTTDL